MICTIYIILNIYKYYLAAVASLYPSIRLVRNTHRTPIRCSVVPNRIFFFIYLIILALMDTLF